jgi:hypothetical protein
MDEPIASPMFIDVQKSHASDFWGVFPQNGLPIGRPRCIIYLRGNLGFSQ